MSERGPQQTQVWVNEAYQQFLSAPQGQRMAWLEDELSPIRCDPPGSCPYCDEPQTECETFTPAEPVW